MDEKIESAYVQLYPYHPTVQGRFAATMSRMKEIDAAAYLDFAEQAQDRVLAYNAGAWAYTPAALGNELRMLTVHTERRLVDDLEQAIRPIREFLVAVVSLSDDDVISRARLPLAASGSGDV